MPSYNNPSTFLDGLGLREGFDDPNGLRNEQLDRIALNSVWIMALAKAIENLNRIYSGHELYTEIVRLITRYDLLREQRSKELQEKLVDALRWSVKPTQMGEVEPNIF